VQNSDYIIPLSVPSSHLVEALSVLHSSGFDEIPKNFDTTTFAASPVKREVQQSTEEELKSADSSICSVVTSTKTPEEYPSLRNGKSFNEAISADKKVLDSASSEVVSVVGENKKGESISADNTAEAKPTAVVSASGSVGTSTRWSECVSPEFTEVEEPYNVNIGEGQKSVTSSFVGSNRTMSYAAAAIPIGR